MFKLNQARALIIALLVLSAILLVACATQPTPAPAPTQAQTSVPVQPTAAPVATAKPTEPTPAAATPKVGGTIIWALQSLPTGLDPQGSGVRGGIPPHYVGSGLVTRDPKTGEIVPFLAESWEVSDDGLTYEFKLKKNIKFHDGSPLTAKDYVYTIQRHKDPATKSPTANPLWGSVASAEAPDDYTLVLKMTKPDASFLPNHAIFTLYAQPVPKHVIERLGNKFDTQPVLSGPFRVKEFQPGLKIVFERNPDFNWGPPWHPGPAYLQTVEFRAVKEYATILAGLESGEIDVADVQPKDVDRLKATGRIRIEEYLQPGLDTTMVLNASKEQWSDVRVRKAINFALDRQTMIKVVALGMAVEQKIPLSLGNNGYWAGSEQLGYGFNLNQAKALMKEAGYVPGSSGILEKDGKPLKVTLMVNTADPYPRLAQMVQEQLKSLGIELNIQQMPAADLTSYMQAGKHDLAVTAASRSPEAGVLHNMFHSSNIGGTNTNRVSDPKLDGLLAASLAATNPTKRMEILIEAQKYIIENAYFVPLYNPKRFYAVSNRVKGFTSTPYTFVWPTLLDAYVDGGK
jgi:peptide/nickel transport system substrate-binding protein